MVFHSDGNNNKPTGADDFLPCLIYTILKAKPKNVASDIQFIKSYRSPDRLNGMDDYYFTAFESAIEFIEHLKADKLKIESQEFANYVDENRKKLGLPPQAEVTPGNDLRNAEKLNVNTVAERFNVEVIEKDYNEEIIKDISKKFYQMKDSLNFDPKKQKFHITETPKLLVKEVDELLDEYKKLCNMHAEMCRKVVDINKTIQEKSQNGQKKNGKKLWNLFKF